MHDMGPHRLIEEHRRLIADYRKDYTSFTEHRLDELVKKLDEYHKPPENPSTQTTP